MHYFSVNLLRFLRVALPGTVAGLLCFTDAFHSLTRFTVVLILGRICLLGPVPLSSTTFAVGFEAYEIIFWCTPAVILIVGYLLIGARERTLKRYAIFCLAFTLFAHAMVTFGLALSIWLHQRGLAWKTAHYPIYVLVYATCITICLIRGRPPRRTPKLST